jgi:hypothetical protein
MSYRNNIDETKSLIKSNAAKHKDVGDDSGDFWEFELLEVECYQAIFEYMDGVGVKIDGVDIRKLLDAEDDADDGVPDAGVEATLLEIIERICAPEHKNAISVPIEVKQLFDCYHETFWPGQTAY